MRHRYRFSRPPRALSRRGVRLDNLALVPASLLPFKKEWQAVANSLPQGQVLLVVPEDKKPQRTILQLVAAFLRSKGHQVTSLPLEQLAGMQPSP